MNSPADRTPAASAPADEGGSPEPSRESIGKPFLCAVPRPDGGAFVIDAPTGAMLRLLPGDVDDLLAGAVPVDEHSDSGDIGPGAESGAKQDVASGPGEAELFREACTEVRSADAIAASLRLGFVVDRLSDDEAAEAVADACDRLAHSTAERIFVHFWVGDADAWDKAGSIARTLSTAGEGRISGVSLTLDPSLPITPAAEAATLELAGLAPRGRQVVFRLGPDALARAGDPDLLARMTFAWQGVLFRQRFSPSFVLAVTPSTLEAIGGSVFEALCFSGVYPRNVFVVFAADGAQNAGLCEVYDTNWDAHGALAPALLSRPTHRLVEPLALGLADVIRGFILSDKRWMRTSGCPFPRQGVVYADGFAARCPVAAVKAAGSALPPSMAAGVPKFSRGQGSGQVWPDEWSGRGPQSVPQCKTCRVAPLCGSGCAVRAYETHGHLMAPDCPPIGRVLTAEGAICAAADV